jgi:hypothetical protein
MSATVALAFPLSQHRPTAPAFPARDAQQRRSVPTPRREVVSSNGSPHTGQQDAKLADRVLAVDPDVRLDGEATMKLAAIVELVHETGKAGKTGNISPPHCPDMLLF